MQVVDFCLPSLMGGKLADAKIIHSGIVRMVIVNIFLVQLRKNWHYVNLRGSVQNTIKRKRIGIRLSGA